MIFQFSKWVEPSCVADSEKWVLRPVKVNNLVFYAPTPTPTHPAYIRVTEKWATTRTGIRQKCSSTRQKTERSEKFRKRAINDGPEVPDRGVWGGEHLPLGHLLVRGDLTGSGTETHRSILCYAVVHTYATVIKITTVAAAGTSFAKRINSEWYGNTQVYTLLHTSTRMPELSK